MTEVALPILHQVECHIKGTYEKLTTAITNIYIIAIDAYNS